MCSRSQRLLWPEPALRRPSLSAPPLPTPPLARRAGSHAALPRRPPHAAPRMPRREHAALPRRPFSDDSNRMQANSRMRSGLAPRRCAIVREVDSADPIRRFRHSILRRLGRIPGRLFDPFEMSGSPGRSRADGRTSRGRRPRSGPRAGRTSRGRRPRGRAIAAGPQRTGNRTAGRPRGCIGGLGLASRALRRLSEVA